MAFAELYLWLKALHVASAMLFAGGIVLVTVVLNASAAPSAPDSEWLQRVRRWDRLVTSPALLLVWALGLTLAITGERFSDLWLQAKLVFVVVLSGLHGLQSGRLRRLAAGASSPVINSGAIVVGSIVAIAILAVTRPG
jgi:uncharacterized membrane protein